MNTQHVYQITRERIAASQEDAVRGLVRTKAMLEDEVEMLREEVCRLQTIVDSLTVDAPICRACEVAQATAADGLCDGCRRAPALEETKLPNRWMVAGREESFAELSDGTPLYPAYYPPRPGEAFRRGMRWWNGSTGEWIGVTPDGRLFRQQQLWGGDSPRPDRWKQFTLTS